MKPIAPRRRLWLVLTLAVLAGTFVLDSVYGQPPRYRPPFPPRPGGMGFNGMQGGPRFGPGGIPGGIPGGPMTKVWICPKCNQQVGTGPVPPALVNCPGCGTQYIAGQGLPVPRPFGPPGLPTLPPDVIVPPAGIPPGAEPQADVQPPVLATEPPPVAQPVQVPPSVNTPTPISTSSGSSASPVSAKLIVLAVAGVLCGGLVLAGVLLLVIQSQKGEEEDPRPRRRRPR
jgi:hypothetical protein